MNRVLRPFQSVFRRAMRWSPRTAYVYGLIRRMRGVHPRECACCGYHGLFLATGMPPRFDALCPRCGSLERHRLFVLASQALDLFAGRGEVLHFAPEPSLRTYVQSRAARYVTADISGIGVDRRESIEAISLPDHSFDVVIACHVLEHVDDRRAMKEVKRILRPAGTFICMVPIIEGWERSYEDPGVQTAAGRELYFGQSDHVRYYGRDFRDRILEVGFTIREFTADGSLSPRYGLLRGEKVFVARASEPRGER